MAVLGIVSIVIILFFIRNGGINLSFDEMWRMGGLSREDHI